MYCKPLYYLFSLSVSGQTEERRGGEGMKRLFPKTVTLTELFIQLMFLVQQ